MDDKNEQQSPHKSRASFAKSTQYFHRQSYASPINLKRYSSKGDVNFLELKFHTIDSTPRELHSTSDPSNYFFYKNFQVVKLEGNLTSLGKGTASEVFQVRNKADGKKYAMKAINKKKVEFLKSLLVELNANYRLNHPNIVEFYSYSETKDYLYVFMEMAGPTLKLEINSKKGIGESLSKIYMKNILSALEYIHKSGYSHGSLCTTHVHVCQDAVAKLTDFKFALEKNKRTQESIWIDYWSLGAILYECLSGKPILNVKSESAKETADMSTLKKEFDNHKIGTLDCSKQANDLLNVLLYHNEELNLKMIKNHGWFSDNSVDDMFLHTDSFLSKVTCQEDIDLMNLLDCSRRRGDYFDEVMNQVKKSRLTSQNKLTKRSTASCQISEAKVVESYSKSRNKSCRWGNQDANTPGMSPEKKVSFKGISPRKIKSGSDKVIKLQCKTKSTHSNTRLNDKSKNDEELHQSNNIRDLKFNILGVNDHKLKPRCSDLEYEALETLESARVHNLQLNIKSSPKKKGFLEAFMDLVNPFNCKL